MQAVRTCICLAAWLLHSACSIPNLEAPGCSEARDAAKRYYSLATGGETATLPEVSSRLNDMRSTTFSVAPAGGDAGRDPYNFSRIQPISSRVGECSIETANLAVTEVTVIWREDDHTAERTDRVTLIRNNDYWLIDRIDLGNQPGPQY